MNAPTPAPQPPSPYSSALATSNVETHTLSVLVDNEPGVLARVVGLFSGRGYNIESLTVAEVAHAEHASRITIVTSGTPEAIEQIGHQLERLVPVHKGQRPHEGEALHPARARHGEGARQGREPQRGACVSPMPSGLG